MTDKMREEFEAWWIKQPFHEQFEDVKDQMRNVWRASRAEMVIQMPPLMTRYEKPDYYLADGVKRAIEAAGAKWRE